MNWGTLAGTALGAILAVGATLLTDRSRWQREKSARERAAKQQLYAEYLGALWLVRHRLRDLKRSVGLTREERATRAGELLASAFHLRVQMMITVPGHLDDLADEAFNRLMELRDLFDEADAGANDRWSAAQAAVGDSLDALAVTMRTDLMSA